LKTSVGYKRIWNISYPIILGSIAQTIINVTDTAFLGRVGEVALGASAIGGIFYLAIIMLGYGIGVGVQIIIARRYGEGKENLIGAIFEHALILLAIMAIFSFIFIRFFSLNLLALFISSGEVLSETLAYLNYRAWGIFFAYFGFVFRAFFIGITKTAIITWTTALMALVNIFLNYCLIFGNLGFPELGIEGAAIASVIAEFTSLLFFMIFLLSTFDFKHYRIFSFGIIKYELLFRIIKLSTPIVLQYFISFAVWFLFFLFVENMGQVPLAISNIIRSVYLIMMLPIGGFSSAINTLVSYLIGQGRPEEVMPVIFKTVKLSFIMVLVIVITCVISPWIIISIYTNNKELLTGSVPVLYVVSAAALVFSVAFVFFNAVAGTGRTKVTFAIELGSIFIYFIIVYFLTKVIQTNIAVVWTVEITYAFLIGLFSLFYLFYGKWKNTRV